MVDALFVMFPFSLHQIGMLHISYSGTKYVKLEILSFQMPETPLRTSQKESGLHWYCSSAGIIPWKNLEMAKEKHRAEEN